MYIRVCMHIMPLSIEKEYTRRSSILPNVKQHTPVLVHMLSSVPRPLPLFLLTHCDCQHKLKKLWNGTAGPVDWLLLLESLAISYIHDSAPHLALLFENTWYIKCNYCLVLVWLQIGKAARSCYTTITNSQNKLRGSVREYMWSRLRGHFLSTSHPT